MELLIAGLLLFAGTHLFPSCVTYRAKVIKSLGENTYKGIYALLSLAGIVLMAVGYARADPVFVYHPVSWGHTLTAILMLMSMVLFAAANMPTNLKRVTRHPMLWGVVVWGVAHLLVRGDLASLILFGGMASYALLAMLSANFRGARKQQEKLPFIKDVKPALAGLVANAVLIMLHPYLFGVAVY